MLDHVLLYVPKEHFEEVVAWYEAALKPIGYEKQKEFPGMAVGLGTSRISIDLWIGAKDSKEELIYPTHVAFRAGNQQNVELFYEEGCKAGGKCNGKPGWRHQ